MNLIGITDRFDIENSVFWTQRCHPNISLRCKNIPLDSTAHCVTSNFRPVWRWAYIQFLKCSRSSSLSNHQNNSVIKMAFARSVFFGLCIVISLIWPSVVSGTRCKYHQSMAFASECFETLTFFHLLVANVVTIIPKFLPYCLGRVCVDWVHSSFTVVHIYIYISS